MQRKREERWDARRAFSPQMASLFSISEADGERGDGGRGTAVLWPCPPLSWLLSPIWLQAARARIGDSNGKKGAESVPGSFPF